MFYKSRVAIATAMVAGSVVQMPATAQTAPQRIEITGSLVKRLDAESSLPVTVISVEELSRQGITTAEQALTRIAANQSNFGVTQSVGATTGGKAEADIRGLSGPLGTNANKTLVLLNGRRIANHSFDAAAVDLNAIPFSAISRIEVLRDGASAIYGTDAIGGVINFILRRDFTGLEISAEYQKPQESGGGTIKRGSLTAGFGSLSTDRFNLVATLDWREQDPLPASGRPFSRTGIIDLSRAGVTSGTSGTSFPGDINGFEPSGPNCAPPESIPRNTSASNTGAFDSCRYDFSSQVDAIPENRQVTGLIRGAFAITADHTLSAEYLRANNEGTARVAAVPQNHLIPTTSPFFPAGALSRVSPGGIPNLANPNGANVPGGVANWRSVPGGKRTSGDDTTTERALIELAGAFSGWDYRTGVLHSRNKSTASVKSGYLDDDLVQTGVFNGVINPFGAQTAAGQAALDAAQLSADTLIGKSELTIVDFNVSKDLFRLPAGALTAAFGVEWRREKSQFEATDINAVLVNSLGIDPNGDTSGSRRSYAAFTEVAIPIVRGFDATLAARYDNYSDFGSTFNPKVSLRWQPLQQVLLRGSYNKGFRAPTLYEIYQPRSLSFTSDSYDDPLLCPGGTAVPGANSSVVCGQQVLARASGPAAVGRPVDTISPEKSDTYTVGIVLEPATNLSFGIDFFDIRVKSLINPLPEQAVFGDPVVYADRFFRCNSLGAAERATIDTCLNTSFNPIAYIDTPTQNLGNLKTRGIDLSANYRTGATPYGSFRIGGEGTYVTKYVYQRQKDGEYINAVARYSDNAPIFRWQHVVTVGWEFRGFNVLLANRHKTGYLDQDGVNEVDSYTTYDASVGFEPFKGLLLNVGVRNLFDKDPPLTVQNSTFQRGYDPRFTDPLGRTFTVRAGYKF